jgi:hypothetical protein
MNLNLVCNSAIFTTALTVLANLSATPPAKAYAATLCQTASELSFVDEYRQLRYYGNDEQFACTIPDGTTLSRTAE